MLFGTHCYLLFLASIQARETHLYSDSSSASSGDMAVGSLRCKMLSRRYEEQRTEVATSRPPITARPSGAFCSPHRPDRGHRHHAIIIAVAVMITGRSRVYPARALRLSHSSLTNVRHGKVDQEDAVSCCDTNRHDSIAPIIAGTLTVFVSQTTSR